MFNRSVTGLVFEASGTVSAVTVSAGLRSLEVTAAGAWPGEGPDLTRQWATALEKAVSEGGLTGTVVMGLPGGAFFKKTLSFPFSSLKRIRQVLVNELEGEIPVSGDSVVADMLITSRSRDGVSGIAVAGDAGLVGQAVSLLPEGHGPASVQLDSVGLASAVLAVDGRDLMVLFKAPGADQAAVVSLASGRMSAMHTVFSEEGGPEALVTALNAVAGPDEAPVLLACGDDNEPLRAALEQAGYREVVAPGDLSLPDGAAGALGPDAGRFLPALGLALSGLGASGSLSLDLRQGPLSPRNPMVELTAPAIRTAAILGGVILLWLVTTVVAYQGARTRFEAVKDRMDSAYSELFPGENVNDAVAQIEQKVLTLERRAQAVTGGQDGSGALAVLSALSRAVPEDSGLTILELSLDGSRLRFDGTVGSYDAVDRVQASLVKSGYFSDVKLQNARVAADAAKVSFRLQMEVTGAAGVN